MKAASFYAQEAINYDNSKNFEAAIRSYLVNLVNL